MTQVTSSIMSWKEPKVGKVTPEGWPAHSSEDRKPDLKELLLYRTMSGLTVGPRSDSQVSSSEAARRPHSAMPGPTGPQPLHLYQQCDTSSLGPPHLGGHNLVTSKLSDNFHRESSKPPMRDVKPGHFSESQLMPPPKQPSTVSGTPRGPEVAIRAPRVSSTSCQGEQKESIGKRCTLSCDVVCVSVHSICQDQKESATHLQDCTFLSESMCVCTILATGYNAAMCQCVNIVILNAEKSRKVDR